MLKFVILFLLAIVFQGGTATFPGWDQYCAKCTPLLSCCKPLCKPKWGSSKWGSGGCCSGLGCGSSLGCGSGLGCRSGLSGLGCGALGGLKAAKLGGMTGGLCPSLFAKSYSTPRYLPYFSTTTSQVPVFKSYFKPIVSTHYSTIPTLQSKLAGCLSKLPCLKNAYCKPAFALPLAKLGSLGSASCVKPKFCSPCSSGFCC